MLVVSFSKCIVLYYFILCGLDTMAHVFDVESMVQLGYDRDQIEQSLEMERYDEIWAAYHLLGLPLYAVSFSKLYSRFF